VSALIIATLAGMTHGLFSLYWAAGGNWLVTTLGHQLVDAFATRRWLLIPLAAIKIGFATLPVLLARYGWLSHRPWRIVCWTGAAALVLWGGINTVTGNLVLSGMLDRAGGYDQTGMIGHAWLWDPLFLLWGLALTMALLLTRHPARDTSQQKTGYRPEHQ
jgi:hypothetical protein